jgi:hypothetical protein
VVHYPPPRRASTPPPPLAFDSLCMKASCMVPLQDFYHPLPASDRPQVLGLTASPECMEQAVRKRNKARVAEWCWVGWCDVGHRDTHAQIGSSRCVSHKCTLLAALLCRHVDHTPNADRSITRRCLAVGSGCLTLFTRLQCSSCGRSVPARLNSTSTLCQHNHSLAVPAYPNTTVFVLLVGL